LSIDNDEEVTKKYISKVVYFLHPTYKKNMITTEDQPYLLSRTAFGKFVVGVEIHF
jgi:transcription initiation factor IIF auxiliary subunit